MDEWWSYTLSDLLLFSPRTYYRLLQRHNETVWPAHIATLGLGLTILLLVRRPDDRYGPVISAILALLWSWVGVAFLWSRYATINWAATYFAGLFTLQALLLFWTGVIRQNLHFQPTQNRVARLGFWLFVAALTVYPWIAPAVGRPWQQAEVFGVLPDPTALGTLGLLLIARENARWKLLVIPILWCTIAGATLWAIARADS